MKSWVRTVFKNPRGEAMSATNFNKIKVLIKTYGIHAKVRLDSGLTYGPGSVIIWVEDYELQRLQKLMQDQETTPEDNGLAGVFQSFSHNDTSQKHVLEERFQLGVGKVDPGLEEFGSVIQISTQSMLSLPHNALYTPVPADLSKVSLKEYAKNRDEYLKMAAQALHDEELRGAPVIEASEEVSEKDSEEYNEEEREDNV